jgi:hypothetical protein
MDQKEWGRGFWMLIWVILFDTNLFTSLTEVKKYIDVITRNLPCDMCREHIVEKMQKFDIISCNSRDEIIEFFVHVYSSTNTSNVNIKTKYDTQPQS